MRDEILEFFKKNEGKFVSGQSMSEACNVSRTAIWKHIQTLRKRGYKIESYTKKGYRLLSSPDLLSPLEVQSLLTTKRFGQNYQYTERLESTNTTAKELAQKGAKEGTVVVAEEQLGGRGRISRGWVSPYGKGIWFSIILRPPFSPMEAPKCTLMAAVALIKAFRYLGLQTAGIKWPNDILVEGRKLVGILTEMSASMEQIDYIVLGMGVNISTSDEDMPKDMQGIVTSFQGEGVYDDRRYIFATILKYLEEQYDKVIAEGFSSTLQEWKELNIVLGEEVQVRGLDSTYNGIAEDIDEDGNLIVQLPDGTKTRVIAGDVSVRTREQQQLEHC